MKILLSPQDEHLRAMNWYVTNGGYVRRNYMLDGARKYELLHRVVMGARDGEIVDHINGNGADNRRENLRVCTHVQNMQNRKMHINNAAGFKGVYPRRGKFCAQIRRDGVKRHLGTYATVAEAKQVYDAAAKALHLEFARFN